MKRKYSGTVKDGYGNVISGATIAVYLAGTGTAASIYLDPDSATAVNSTTSDSYGRYVFYVSAFDYDSDETFKILISKTGYVTNTIDHITIEDVVAQAYTISANTTVTTNIRIPKGVTYSVSSGVTLTFSGEFDAGLYQVFSGSGTVAFSAGSVKEIYPEWWGAAGNGTTDDTAAIQKCVTCGCTASLHMKFIQTYLITSTITFAKTYDEMTVFDGNGTAIFDFEPAAADIMFDISNSSTEMFCFHFKDFRVTSDDTTYKKTAILVSDISTSKFENIIIGAGDKWTGAYSVGIQTKGRELTSFENLRIHADIPIQISKNPNSTTYQTDHFHFKDLTLVCLDDTQYCILVDDGVNMLNLTFDGYQSWNHGLYGFYYNNTEATGESGGWVTIKNVRWEQTAAGGNGYMVSITDNSTNSYLLDHYVFENCYVVGDTDTPANFSGGGFNLKEVSNVAILNCSALTSYAGSVMLNFNACLNIRVTNFGTPGATWPTLTSMSTIKEIRSYNGYAIVDAIYDYSLPLGTVTTIIPSYIQGAGTPVGSQVPDFIGQEYMDSNSGDWYKAYGALNTQWGKLTN